MKRNYIVAIFALCTFSVSCGDMEYMSNDPDKDMSAPHYADVQDIYQTYSLYFRPSQGWVGDPMPFYDNGKFHVFYLQDARGGAETFHPWYKATTTDLLTYEDNGEVIPCGDPRGQEQALGTGSVCKHENTYYAFYTAHNANLDPHEKVFMATSTDLQNWTKHPEFELVAEDGYDRNEFRDPQIIRDEVSGTYKMLISTRADYKGSWRAVVAQYSSTDLWNWTLEEPFYDDPATFMIECPDVFTMGGYQYIIYSDIDDRKVHYRYRSSGVSDWIVPTQSALDGIAYYAAKSASDGNKRYLFGWCPTRDSYNDTSDYSWGGSLITHELTQNSDGTLHVIVPTVVRDNFNSKVDIKTLLSINAKNQNGNYQLCGGSEEKALNLFDRQKGAYKITATVQPSTSTCFGFEFGAGATRNRIHDLIFDPEANEIRLDYIENGERFTRTSSLLPVSDKNEYRVTIIVENSVCCVYINDMVTLTCRIYQINNNPWGIFAYDGEAEFRDITIYR